MEELPSAKHFRNSWTICLEKTHDSSGCIRLFALAAITTDYREISAQHLEESLPKNASNVEKKGKHRNIMMKGNRENVQVFRIFHLLWSEPTVAHQHADRKSWKLDLCLIFACTRGTDFPEYATYRKLLSAPFKIILGLLNWCEVHRTAEGFRDQRHSHSLCQFQYARRIYHFADYMWSSSFCKYHEIDVHGNTVLLHTAFFCMRYGRCIYCKWIKFVYGKQLKATGKDPASIYGRRDQKSWRTIGDLGSFVSGFDGRNC